MSKYGGLFGLMVEHSLAIQTVVGPNIGQSTSR